MAQSGGSFPGGPGVRTQSFHSGVESPVPGQETKVLQALCVIKKKKKKSQRRFLTHSLAPECPKYHFISGHFLHQPLGDRATLPSATSGHLCVKWGVACEGLSSGPSLPDSCRCP